MALHLLKLSTSSDTEDLRGLLPLPLPRLLKVLAGLPGALPSASSSHPWVKINRSFTNKNFRVAPDISVDLISACPICAHFPSVGPDKEHEMSLSL